MSEVIEDYIRRHPGLSLQQALDGFMHEERIRSWVDGDPVRRERLQREFHRVWVTTYATAVVATPKPMKQTLSTVKETEIPLHIELAHKTARKGPAAGATIHEVAPPSPAPEQEVAAALPPALVEPREEAPVRRKLKVLCTTCGAFAVHAVGTRVTCLKCMTDHSDMLGLVSVTPVGPFAFTFGRGWKGVLRATLLVAALGALYGVLQWS